MQFNDNLSTNRVSDLRSEEEERFVQSIAPQYKLQYVSLRGYTLNPEALSLIPEKTARDFQMVGFDLKQKNLYIGVKNPTETSVQQELQRLTAAGYVPQVFMCSMASLEHAWKRYKDVVKSTLEKKGVFDISSEDIIRLRQGIRENSDKVRCHPGIIG